MHKQGLLVCDIFWVCVRHLKNNSRDLATDDPRALCQLRFIEMPGVRKYDITI